MTTFTGPLFIVGSPRSGTKLLRALLNRHPKINICVPETHFIPQLYADFSDGTDRFNGDVDGLFAAFNMTPFQTIAKRTGQRAMTRADFDPFERQSDWAAIFDRILRFYGDHTKVADAICGDKTPGYVRDMPLLKQIMPNARFLHIIRDPRDVALSVQAAWQHAIYRTGTKWTRNIAVSRRDRAGLGADYMEVHYESLLQAPDTVLSKVCDFLNVPFTPAMTRLGESSENIGSAVGKAYIDATNMNKFRTQMPPRVQKRLEQIVFEQAQDTPYEMDYATAHVPLSKVRYGSLAAADGAKSLIRYLRVWGVVDGIKINIGNRLQKRRRIL